MTNNDIKRQLLKVIEEEITIEEHREFCEWVDQHVYLTEEGLFDKAKEFFQSIPEKFKDAMALIKQLAIKAGSKIKDVLMLFRNEKVYSFFKAIGWNVSLVVRAIKIVMKKWTEVRQLLIDKLTELKPLQYVKQHWNQFCVWADKNIFKHMGKVGSLLLVGLMLWVWFNMSFTGDFTYDFDNTLVLKGLTEGITFTDCFHNNFDMLILLTVGLTGGALFMWGPATKAANAIRISVSLLYSLIVSNRDTVSADKFKEIFTKQDALVPPKKVANIKKKIIMSEANELLEIASQTPETAV